MGQSWMVTALTIAGCGRVGFEGAALPNNARSDAAIDSVVIGTRTQMADLPP